MLSDPVPLKILAGTPAAKTVLSLLTNTAISLDGIKRPTMKCHVPWLVIWLPVALTVLAAVPRLEIVKAIVLSVSLNHKLKLR